MGLLDTVQREGGVNDGPELAAAEVGQGPLCKISYQRSLYCIDLALSVDPTMVILFCRILPK